MQTIYKCPCCGKESPVEVSVIIRQKYVKVDGKIEEKITLEDTKIEPVEG